MPVVTCGCGARVEATRTSATTFSVRDTGEQHSKCVVYQSEMKEKGRIEPDFVCSRLMRAVQDALHRR